MKERMFESLQKLLEQWTRNQKTHILEGAEDQATLLEHRFYKFVDAFTDWFGTIEKPGSLEEALKVPEIVMISDQLPPPLYLPFENELDMLIDGVEQDVDEKYD